MGSSGPLSTYSGIGGVVSSGSITLSDILRCCRCLQQTGAVCEKKHQYKDINILFLNYKYTIFSYRTVFSPFKRIPKSETMLEDGPLS